MNSKPKKQTKLLFCLIVVFLCACLGDPQFDADVDANCTENSCTYGSPKTEEILKEAKNIIFVRSGGAGGTGTKEDPFGSYNEAIETAGVDDVVLIQGDLNEQLIVKNGVHILAGRNNLWQAADDRSKIEPGSNAMRAGFPWAGLVIQDIASDVVIHNLEVTTPNSETDSSYGVFSVNSTVELQNVRAFAGNGASGDGGNQGQVGEPGTVGSDPADHFNSYATTVQFPNVETVNVNCPLNTEGGFGGKGVVRGIRPSNGEKGSPLTTGGGNGGFAAETGIALVGDGADSLFIVPSGAGGAGGTNTGDISSMGWLPGGLGSTGDRGENGRGGGGGGGADFVDGQNGYYGPNGANGGSGGCGGLGGSGGQPGGGSIGLYSVNSTLLIASSDFSASVGGAGGAGGSGGNGGEGGIGGVGSTQRCTGAGIGECINDTNLYNIPSGNGGKGGNGGSGGDGGGGAGGVSYGGLCSNSMITITNSFFTKGIGGLEGAPNGEKGESLNQKGCE